MKKVYFSFLSLFLIFSSFSQQIDNGSMEEWDDLGSSQEEPSNWNSFMSATGGLSLFGSQQVERSSDTPMDSDGMFSARAYSKSTFGIIANGNLTLGQINMGSSTANSSDNFNYSKTSSSDFSQVLTDLPDSIVFWVKFQASSNTDSARIHAVIHDDYELHDPIDNDSEPHVVAAAGLNYGITNGWERKSVPFESAGAAQTPEFILVTFTTNKTPGGGSDGDAVFIDDVELIYNTSSLGENSLDLWVSYSEKGLSFSDDFNTNSDAELFTTSGVLVQKSPMNAMKGLHLNPGMYMVMTDRKSFKFIAH